MNRANLIIRTGVGAAALLGAALAFFTFEITFAYPPARTVQTGYRGTGMDQVINPRTAAAQFAVNQPPEVHDPADNDGPRASETFENLRVLGHLSVGQFGRVMQAMTDWVAPQQGCNYCHVDGNFASDDIYTKVVARRMLQMVMHVNADWRNHVGETGVTCYTCHRGQPVPAQAWSLMPDPPQAGGMAQAPSGQNRAAPAAGLTSLPYDPFAPYLVTDAPLRIVSQHALAGAGTGRSMVDAERTYALMISMSEALGVNCTYCHNTRSFADWDQSRPQRATAWYALRMVRDLNAAYLDPLQSTFPANRLGPAGDPLKVNCATCHQGVFRPLFGAAAARDYPELHGPGPQAATPAAAPAAAPAAPPAAAPAAPRR